MQAAAAAAATTTDYDIGGGGDNAVTTSHEGGAVRKMTTRCDFKQRAQGILDGQCGAGCVVAANCIIDIA